MGILSNPPFFHQAIQLTKKNGEVSGNLPDGTQFTSQYVPAATSNPLKDILGVDDFYLLSSSQGSFVGLETESPLTIAVGGQSPYKSTSVVDATSILPPPSSNNLGNLLPLSPAMARLAVSQAILSRQLKDESEWDGRTLVVLCDGTSEDIVALGASITEKGELKTFKISFGGLMPSPEIGSNSAPLPPLSSAPSLRDWAANLSPCEVQYSIRSIYDLNHAGFDPFTILPQDDIPAAGVWLSCCSFGRTHSSFIHGESPPQDGKNYLSPPRALSAPIPSSTNSAIIVRPCVTDGGSPLAAAYNRLLRVTALHTASKNGISWPPMAELPNEETRPLPDLSALAYSFVIAEITQRPATDTINAGSFTPPRPDQDFTDRLFGLLCCAPFEYHGVDLPKEMVRSFMDENVEDSVHQSNVLPVYTDDEVGAAASIVLQALVDGRLEPMVDPCNETKLAQYIRELLSLAKNKRINPDQTPALVRQADSIASHLDEMAQSPTDMLVNLGLHSLSQDYVFWLTRKPWLNRSALEWFIESDLSPTERLSRLHRLHVATETILLVANHGFCYRVVSMLASKVLAWARTDVTAGLAQSRENTAMIDEEDENDHEVTDAEWIPIPNANDWARVPYFTLPLPLHDSVSTVLTKISTFASPALWSATLSTTKTSRTLTWRRTCLLPELEESARLLADNKDSNMPSAQIRSRFKALSIPEDDFLYFYHAASALV